MIIKGKKAVKVNILMVRRRGLDSIKKGIRPKLLQIQSLIITKKEQTMLLKTLFSTWFKTRCKICSQTGLEKILV